MHAQPLERVRGGRGLNAPPRRIVAPAAGPTGGLQRLVRVSTAHGPAISVNVSGPIGTCIPIPTQT